jgi:hypothetical protein
MDRRCDTPLIGSAVVATATRRGSGTRPARRATTDADDHLDEVVGLGIGVASARRLVAALADNAGGALGFRAVRRRRAEG